MTSPQVLTRFLTRDEETRFFRAVKAAAGSETQRQRLARRDYALFKLLRHTGIRVTALVHITCGDAREAIRTKYLQRRGDKGGRDGRTYCNAKARRALIGLLSTRKALGFVEADDARLITSRQAPHISVRAIQKRMVHWRDGAGLTVQASPHWWRHTLGHRLVADSTAANPLGITQVQLDHRNIQSTAIYTRPTREDIEAALEEAG